MAFEICIRLSKWSHIVHRYDRTNNTRWGVIYLAQIYQLPVEVIQQFQRGNCVVNKKIKHTLLQSTSTMVQLLHFVVA